MEEKIEKTKEKTNMRKKGTILYSFLFILTLILIPKLTKIILIIVSSIEESEQLADFNILLMIIITAIICFFSKKVFKKDQFTKNEAKNILFKAIIVLLLGFVMTSYLMQCIITENEITRIEHLYGGPDPYFNIGMSFFMENVYNNKSEYFLVDWLEVLIKEIILLSIMLIGIFYIKNILYKRIKTEEEDAKKEKWIYNLFKFIICYSLFSIIWGIIYKYIEMAVPLNKELNNMIIKKILEQIIISVLTYRFIISSNNYIRDKQKDVLFIIWNIIVVHILDFVYILFISPEAQSLLRGNISGDIIATFITKMFFPAIAIGAVLINWLLNLIDKKLAKTC